MTEANPLAKLTKGELADAFGLAKARFKRVEEPHEALKAEILRRGLKAAEGEKFVVTVSESTFNGIDVPAARAELGEAWCKKHAKPSTRTTVAVHPIAVEAKAKK